MYYIKNLFCILLLVLTTSQTFGQCPNSVTISANQALPICLPAPGLVLTSTITSTGLISLQWYKGTSTIPGATNASYSPTVQGIYKLVITGSCPTVSSNTIAVAPTPTVSMSASSGSICNNVPITLTASLTTGSGPGITYQWIYNSTNVGTSTTTYTTITSGTYAVIASNTGSCSAMSNTMSIAGFSLIADAGPDQIYTTIAAPIGGTACATGGTSPYSYTWSPNTAFVSGNINQCNNTVGPSSTILYTLTVVDANGCVAYDNVLVTPMSTITTYAVAKKEIEGGYHLPVAGKVYFKFEEEYTAGTLSYKIFEYNSLTPNIQPANPACPLTPSTKVLGDNRYYIDISTCSLQSSRFYVVEITNDKKEKFYFKFLN